MDIKQQEEEIKKKFGKNRTNSTRARFARRSANNTGSICSLPCVVLQHTGGDDIIAYDFDTGASNVILNLSNGNSQGVPTGSGPINIYQQAQTGDIAKYGDKFWIRERLSGQVQKFHEFILNNDCSCTFIRSVNVQTTGFISGNLSGITAVDDTN